MVLVLLKILREDSQGNECWRGRTTGSGHNMDGSVNVVRVCHDVQQTGSSHSVGERNARVPW